MPSRTAAKKSMVATGKVVLDTSVIVAALRRRPGIMERLRSVEELWVPLIALGELEYGVNLATQTTRQREAVRAFMQGASLLTPTSRTAEEYGRIKAELSRAGAPIPENDIWIAALAREHQLPLTTLDEHFSRVSGLTLPDWRA
jgi:tRNA(fMet)-specific endonuclease VapC